MMRRKWKSRRGETLIETLISLFISALALTMLAGMIFKSAKLLNKGMADMRDYTETMNLLNNPSGGAAGKPGVSVGSGATVTISVLSGDTGDTFQILDIWYVLDSTDAERPTLSYVRSGA